MWKKRCKIWCMAALLVMAALPAGAANYYTVGNKGDDVLLIQKQLRKLGYNVKADGVYSKDTAKAVSKFQSSKKIQVSGNVGGWTYYLLTGKRTMLSQADAAKGMAKKSGKVNGLAKNKDNVSQVKYTKLKGLTGKDRVGS